MVNSLNGILSSVHDEVSRTKYVLSWGGQKFPTLILDFWIRSFVSQPHVLTKDYFECILYIRDTTHISAFFSDASQAQMNRAYGEHYLQESNILELPLRYQEITEQLQEFFKEIRDVRDWSISSGSLQSYFSRFSVLMEQCFGWYRATTEEAEIGVSAYVKKALGRCYSPEEVNAHFAVLVESTKDDLARMAQRSWRALLAKPWDEEQIIKYAYSFPAEVINLYDRQDILDFLHERYTAEQPSLTLMLEEAHDKDTHRKKIIKQQGDILSRCGGNATLRTYVGVLQDFGGYRLQLKYLWSGAALLALPLFKEIANRTSLPLSDFFDLYLRDDVDSFLTGDHSLSEADLAERRRSIVVRIHNGSYRVLQGSTALAIGELLEKPMGTTELVGQAASPGFARGSVRVLHSTSPSDVNALAKQFKSGDILVAGSTEPVLVPLMKKAGGIVTVLGGITSHAAVMSREFKKPCVVGVRNALQILKDGDQVEVDGDTGVVRIV